jgi:uncharacterized protein YndB with AHSA1/START domain
MKSSTDRICKRVLIWAALARAWRALADAEEFARWLGVALAGQSFEAAKRVRGQITDAPPAARWATTFRLNSDGWAGQMRNVERHVTAF